jgi:hypothetical protein
LCTSKNDVVIFYKHSLDLKRRIETHARHDVINVESNPQPGLSKVTKPLHQTKPRKLLSGKSLTWNPVAAPSISPPFHPRLVIKFRRKARNQAACQNRSRRSRTVVCGQSSCLDSLMSPVPKHKVGTLSLALADMKSANSRLLAL